MTGKVQLPEARGRAVLLFRNMPEGACFSPCRTWRYTLWRRWSDKGSTERFDHDVLFDETQQMPEENLRRMVAFIGLNPSTADEHRNDPTITRCINFAKAWGYDGMAMLNLFAFRATDPRDMKKMATPVGPLNDAAIEYSLKTFGKVVACWGNHGKFKDRSDFIRRRASDHCIEKFGLTKLGEPQHPLYLSADTKPTLWTP